MAQILSIQKTLAADISNPDWMTASTRREALRKLQAYRIKVGYPDHWRDYNYGWDSAKTLLVRSMLAESYSARELLGRVVVPPYARFGRQFDSHGYDVWLSTPTRS